MQDVVAQQPLTGRQAMADYVGRIAGEQRLQRRHRAPHFRIVEPDDVARTGGVAHVQRAARVERENRPAPLRPGQPLLVVGGNGHGVGPHQGRHQPRVAITQQDIGDLGVHQRALPPTAAGRVQCSTIPRTCRSGAL